MTKQYILAYIALFITVTIWAGNAVVGRAMMTMDETYSAYQVTFLRHTISALFLLPFTWIYMHKYWHQIWAERWFILQTTVLGLFLFTFMNLKANENTLAMNCAIVQGAAPTLTILLGRILYKTTVSWGVLVFAGLSLLGIVWIVSKGDMDVLRQMSFNIGDIYMLIGSTVWALYTLVVQHHKTNIPTMPLLGVSFSLGAILALLYITITGDLQFAPEVWTPKFTGLLFYMGVIAGIVAYLFYVQSVPIVKSVVASIFTNFMPILGSIMGIVLLDEQLRSHHLIGGALIVFSVFSIIYITNKQQATD